MELSIENQISHSYVQLPESTPLNFFGGVNWDDEIRNSFWKNIKFIFQTTNQGLTKFVNDGLMIVNIG